MNKYNNWIYRGLDVGLATNGNGNIEVVVRDSESGDQGNLVFGNRDTKEEIVTRIGEEVFFWISLMKEQLDYDE